MSDAALAVKAKVEQLPSLAEEVLSTGDARAASLDPSHSRANALLASAENGLAADGLTVICRDYIATRDQTFGHHALRVSSQPRLDGQDVVSGLHLLLAPAVALPLRDQLVANLLAHGAAKAVVVEELQASVTESFTNLYNVGCNTVDALVAILLDPTPWPSTNIHTSAQRNIFTLLLAKIMEAGMDVPETAMKAVAKLLAAEPALVAPIFDKDSFETVLSFLCMDQTPALRSQATVTVAKYLETMPDQGKQLLSNYVVSRVRQSNSHDMIAAFSVACAIFPIAPALAAGLFLTAGFVEQLARLAGVTKSSRLRHTSLELLSAACVDKACRKAISQACVPVLQNITVKPENDKDLSTATLVLSKLQASTEVDKNTIQGLSSTDVVATFQRLLLAKDAATVQNSIEGLAYISFQPRAKEQICSDSSFLKDLLTLLDKPDISSSIVFGGLNIFANLIAHRPSLTPEQSRLAELKAYADSQKPAGPDQLDDDAHVDARCQAVIQSGLVPFLVKVHKTSTSTIQSLTATISLNLSRSPKSRGKLVQQGLLDVCLRLCSSIPSSATTDANATRTLAARSACAQAIAYLLLPLNPTLVFNTPANRSVPNTVRALTSILSPTPGAQSETTDYEPNFDSLRALTNLASLDEPARASIVSLAWPGIEELLWSRNLRVQQAAVECVNNLIVSTAAAAKFLDGKDAAASQRLRLLFALTGSEVLGVKRAAAGALAMMLGHCGCVDAFVNVPGLIEGVVELVEEGNVEVGKRALAILSGLVLGTGSEERSLEKARGVVRRAGGVQALGKLRGLSAFREDAEEIKACLKCLGSG